MYGSAATVAVLRGFCILFSPERKVFQTLEKSERISKLFSQFVEGMGERIRFGEPLSKHSSLRIGGPAALWAEPSTQSELVELLSAARKLGIDHTVVGLGSNTLYSDDGIDGLVLRLAGELADWRVDDGVLSVGGGAINAHLVRAMFKMGWVGMEFLALIPGTLGGAVVMNAGTQEKALSEILVDVDVIDPSQPWMVRTMSRKELQMSYRHTSLDPGVVVASARLRVEQGDVEAAALRVREDKDRRNKTQPYRLASVGSTFANPPGDYAGRLIEAVGLKGVAVGGARVSELHGNFFINEDHATTEDFLTLMAMARVRVRQLHQIELRPEVSFVGFDGWSRLAQIEQELEAASC